ncbi:hypothetical protein Csa_023811, partial [Cucumis sativus]
FSMHFQVVTHMLTRSYNYLFSTLILKQWLPEVILVQNFLLKRFLLQEIKLEWGMGLAKNREVEAKLMELELEKDRPFARSR